MSEFLFKSPVGRLLSFRLTLESTEKSENEGRLHGQENIFLVHDMTLLPVLHNSAFLNALECKGAIRDTLCLVKKYHDKIFKFEGIYGTCAIIEEVSLYDLNLALTRTSLTNPNPPAPKALIISRSLSSALLTKS